MMLISEFSRETGLSVDTIRFYIRKGLIKPETSSKGGSNPYQVFTAEHVEAAKIIRTSQALGFPLKNIAGTISDYMNGELPQEKSVAILRDQLAIMEDKATQLSAVIGYMKAKLVWMEAGSNGPRPNFDDYVRREFEIGLKC